MEFLERLQRHIGGLLHLRTELFWYDSRGWDNNSGRICLLLDVITADADTILEPTARTKAVRGAGREATSVAFLLIEGKPQWIWVTEQDVDLL